MVNSSRKERLEALVQNQFRPLHFELHDQSAQHAGHHGQPENPSGTHFEMLLVSDVFRGLSRLQRQKAVHELLKAEFSSGLHALSMKLMSPEEWQAR